MTTWEAIEQRISCRAYDEAALSAEEQETIQKLIQSICAESGLHFLFCDDTVPGQKVKMSNMFSGSIHNFAALYAKDDPLEAEKLGYYGQKLMMELTKMGLGTCWVASTYDAASISLPAPEGELLWDIMPFGHPAKKMPVKQRTVRTGLRQRDRKLSEFVESDLPFDELPDWIRKGAEAILLGPSAVNEQAINLVWKDNTLTAYIYKEDRKVVYNDLGIAKYMFVLGAAECGVTGNWDWGNGGAFHLV